MRSDDRRSCASIEVSIKHELDREHVAIDGPEAMSIAERWPQRCLLRQPLDIARHPQRFRKVELFVLIGKVYLRFCLCQALHHQPASFSELLILINPAALAERTKYFLNLQKFEAQSS